MSRSDNLFNGTLFVLSQVAYILTHSIETYIKSKNFMRDLGAFSLILNYETIL